MFGLCNSFAKEMLLVAGMCSAEPAPSISQQPLDLTLASSFERTIVNTSGQTCKKPNNAEYDGIDLLDSSELRILKDGKGNDVTVRICIESRPYVEADSASSRGFKPLGPQRR